VDLGEIVQDFNGKVLTGKTFTTKEPRVSVNASDKEGSIAQKKAGIRDDPAGPRSEPAFSLNWITSCLPTIRPERLLNTVAFYGHDWRAIQVG
jgi:hypothetical protein